MKTESIKKNIMGGAWKPNIYLTNLAIANFQADEDFIAGKLFPIVPVPLPTGKYYKFSKADLARDNMQRKPLMGKVPPAVLGQSDDQFDVKVDQLILGVDQIGALPFAAAGAPGVADPRRAIVRTAMEQAQLHLDIMFSEKYFQPGVWAEEKTGVGTAPSGSQFLKFDLPAADPVRVIDDAALMIRKNGRRRPNKVALGIDTFVALKHNPTVLERVKYSGSTANPATVNENVLAQLFGVEEVVVLASTQNKAKLGKAPDMEFVCDPKGMLLLYAPNAPAIDEPSAGYTFAWDMLGGGQFIAVSQFEGEPGTHTEYVEAILAYDMKVTGEDLAVYFKNCVGA